ncbi:hypothetical protein [Chitinophaga sp. ARDCPP14]|uniref:hypothetical protein n=1 Tax=Chitinophaga sp. ARDCPP14 TaxID=3391139 RepID=UPI003F528269
MEKMNPTMKVLLAIMVMAQAVLGTILYRNFTRFKAEMHSIHENKLSGIITAYEFQGRGSYDLTIVDKGVSKVIPCPAFGRSIKSIKIGDSIYKASFSDSAYIFRKESNGEYRFNIATTISF